jgi:hypothetical protein
LQAAAECVEILFHQGKGILNNMSFRTTGHWLLLTLAVLCCHCTASAAYYNRQTYYGSGGSGPVGDGNMSMSNTVNTVFAGFNKGTGSFTDNLVMFIDCVPGGFTTTSGFTNSANALEIAISGSYKTSRSIANFAPGFAADYAIVVGVNNGSAIYKLVDDASGPNLQLVRGFNLMPAGSPNYPQYYWQFGWTDIGLTNAYTNFFKFETSLVTATGSRALQSFEGITGVGGYSTITFTNYDTYGVEPVPENTTVALAVFGTLAAGVVVVKQVKRWSTDQARNSSG